MAAASASSASASLLLAASIVPGSIIADQILRGFASHKAAKICCISKRLEKEPYVVRRPCVNAETLTPLACVLEPRPHNLLGPVPHDQPEVSPCRSVGGFRPIRSRKPRPAAACRAGAARPHGERDPRACHGRGRAGEIRPSRPADGRGRYGNRAVHSLHEIGSSRSGLAGPRPLRAFGRAWLDADLRAAPPARLRKDDDRGDQAL